MKALSLKTAFRETFSVGMTKDHPSFVREMSASLDCQRTNSLPVSSGSFEMMTVSFVRALVAGSYSEGQAAPERS